MESNFERIVGDLQCELKRGNKRSKNCLLYGNGYSLFIFVPESVNEFYFPCFSAILYFIFDFPLFSQRRNIELIL